MKIDLPSLERFIADVVSEFVRTSGLYPTNEDHVAALSEEAGEVAKAMIDHRRGKATEADIWTECVQTANMALHVALRGDASFPYQGPTPPEPAASNVVELRR